MRDLKHFVKPPISAEAATRGIGMDRTKTVIGAGSQIATAQPQVKFAKVGAYECRHPSSVFQVPQFTNTHKKYLPGQGPNFASNARDNYFIKSSLPKLKLSEFSGDPLEWPEWSQLLQATVHLTIMDDSAKLNHLKTMVTGKAKEEIAGLG